MPTNEEVKAYFDRIARDWDRIRQDYYGVEVIDRALTAAGLSPEDSDERSVGADAPSASLTSVASLANLLVDVGCGTGFLTAGLAPRARAVIAVDDSEGMLEVADENLKALGIGNVELKRGSVGNLPLESDSAEAVFVNMVLHHAADPQVMVREMARVARPDGRVVITDMDSHTNEWFRMDMADVWLGFTEADVRQYFKEAGLTNVQFGWVGTQ
jgi:ubiquinone/menaquinone biosynthesis C-methylase UbiE